MRVASDVDQLELAEYQKAVRLVLRHPLITATYPDPSALPLARKWIRQLRADLGEALGYGLTASGDTIRLRRAQDTLDRTRPALTRAGRPFERRRYGYLVLALSALGRSGSQIALGELAEAVAADAARLDGLGMDTGRKPDRDAFVDAVAWLEVRGALRLADGSASDWASDPERAEALYDIDREVVGAIYAPSRVLQHLTSVTELLDGGGVGGAAGPGLAQGREARRRISARQARRLVVEQPVVYYADVDPALLGQLRSASLAEDVERLTGQALERRAEGVALIGAGTRFTDVPFPGTGSVAQAALLLCARIAGYLSARGGRVEPLPAASAAERLAEAAARIDSALPDRGTAAALLTGQFGAGPPAPGPMAEPPARTPSPAPPAPRPAAEPFAGMPLPAPPAPRTAAEPSAGPPFPAPPDQRDQGEQPDGSPFPLNDLDFEAGTVRTEAAYPFLSEAWLAGELRKLIAEFGAGMSEKRTADPGRLLAEAVALLTGHGLVARVDGGVLVLPLLARYRGVTAQLRDRP